MHGGGGGGATGAPVGIFPSLVHAEDHPCQPLPQPRLVPAAGAAPPPMLRLGLLHVACTGHDYGGDGPGSGVRDGWWVKCPRGSRRFVATATSIEVLLGHAHECEGRGGGLSEVGSMMTTRWGPVNFRGVARERAATAVGEGVMRQPPSQLRCCGSQSFPCALRAHVAGCWSVTVTLSPHTQAALDAAQASPCVQPLPPYCIAHSLPRCTRGIPTPGFPTRSNLTTNRHVESPTLCC